MHLFLFFSGESILLKEEHEVKFLPDHKLVVLQNDQEYEIIADLRRLSTDSYVIDRGNAMATQWIWYCKEGREIWREYDQDNWVSGISVLKRMILFW